MTSQATRRQVELNVRAIKEKIVHYKTIVYGILIFIAMFAVNTLFVKFISSGEPIWSAETSISTLERAKETYSPTMTALMSLIYEVLNVFIWFVPGIYVGYKAKTSGILHGTAVGVVGFGFTYIITLVFSLYDPYQESLQVVFNALSFGFLCGLAAGVGELYAVKSSR